MLLLHRQNDKPHGNTWGVPAGKAEHEMLVVDIQRELEEETGIALPLEEFKHWGGLFVRHLEYDFIYVIFTAEIDEFPVIKLNPKEHKGFTWVIPMEALDMKLIPDEDQCIKLVYKINPVVGSITASVAQIGDKKEGTKDGQK